MTHTLAYVRENLHAFPLARCLFCPSPIHLSAHSRVQHFAFLGIALHFILQYLRLR
jgi:hypothetical protein